MATMTIENMLHHLEEAERNASHAISALENVAYKTMNGQELSTLIEDMKIASMNATDAAAHANVAKRSINSMRKRAVRAHAAEIRGQNMKNRTLNSLTRESQESVRAAKKFLADQDMPHYVVDSVATQPVADVVAMGRHSHGCNQQDTAVAMSTTALTAKVITTRIPKNVPETPRELKAVRSAIVDAMTRKS